MTSGAEERPKLVMGGYKQYRSQWVKSSCEIKAKKGRVKECFNSSWQITIRGCVIQHLAKKKMGSGD